MPMLEDILAFYPNNSKNVATGLFKTPVASRIYCNPDNYMSKSTTGYTSTFYSDAYSIKINDNLTLLDIFHGCCYDFALYFVSKHPDWKVMELTRPDSFFNKCNHVFAIKETDDGRTLFADARGITDNPLEFFHDYKYSKHNMDISPIDTTNLTLSDNSIDVCQKAYDIIYKDEPIPT